MEKQMIEFIREFPILSLFIFGYIIGFISSAYHGKPKYYKYWKIIDPMVYLGFALMAISGILKLLGF